MFFYVLTVLTGGVASTATAVLTAKSMENLWFFYVLVVLTGGVALTAIAVLTAKSMKNLRLFCFSGLDRWSGLHSNSGLDS